MSNKKNKTSSNKKKKIVIISIIVAILLIILFGVFSCVNWSDPNAKLGYFPGKTDEEIQKELNTVVEEGQMNVNIANTIKFLDGASGPGKANIENIAANDKEQKIQIYLKDEPNTLIYESGGLAPGYYIDEIYLNSEGQKLSNGAYKVVVIFEGYKKNTFMFDWLVTNYEYVGKLAAEVNLLIS